MQLEIAEVRQVCCVACRESLPSFEVVSVGSIENGYRELCSRCFNTEMAQLGSLAGSEHFDLKPVTLAGSDGKEHEFHFRTHLFGSGVALDAFEIRGDHQAGYQFQIIGEPEEDLLILLGKLIEKIRRGARHRSRPFTDRCAQAGSQRVSCTRTAIVSSPYAKPPIKRAVARLSDAVKLQMLTKLGVPAEGWQNRTHLSIPKQYT